MLISSERRRSEDSAATYALVPQLRMASTTRHVNFKLRKPVLTFQQMALPENAAVEQSDHKPLETIVNSIVKEKQTFQRLTLSKDDL